MTAANPRTLRRIQTFMTTSSGVATGSRPVREELSCSEPRAYTL
jgi:hypothetical protein